MSWYLLDIPFLKFLDCGNEKSEITLLIFLWEICFIIIIMGFVEFYCSTSRISRASDSSLVKAAFRGAWMFWAKWSMDLLDTLEILEWPNFRNFRKWKFSEYHEGYLGRGPSAENWNNAGITLEFLQGF